MQDNAFFLPIITELDISFKFLRKLKLALILKEKIDQIQKRRLKEKRMYQSIQKLQQAKEKNQNLHLQIA